MVKKLVWSSAFLLFLGLVRTAYLDSVLKHPNLTFVQLTNCAQAGRAETGIASAPDLEEEKQTDQKLTDLSKKINVEANKSDSDPDERRPGRAA
jgi:hypothetical protein